MAEKGTVHDSSGVTYRYDEATESYSIIKPRNENPNQVSESIVPPPGVAVAETPAPPPPGVAVNPNPPPPVAAPMGAMAGTEMKKKRGRPRKYPLTGKDGGSVNTTLSPMPLSASIPLTGNYPPWKHSTSCPMECPSFTKKPKLDFSNPGIQLANCFGPGFTPHVITVNIGEDVNSKIMSLLAQQKSRSLCILSANGSISNVTLRHPNASGGTLTYEGPFEILVLNGSFTPIIINEAQKSISGGMSVTLACPDGRVLGGGVAGILIAGGAVQIVAASFLNGKDFEDKYLKKNNLSFTTPILAKPVSAIRSEEIYKNSNVMNFEQGGKVLGSENNISFTGSESPDQSLSR